MYASSRGIGRVVVPHLIEQLLALAATQHGVVSTRQAMQLGVTPVMLRHAVRRGWLRPLRHGIYAVVGSPPSRWQPLMAAALAAGPDGVISHRSAAVIHRFHGVKAGLPELSYRNRGGRRLTGVTIHRPCDLGGDDIVIQRGVRLTAPVRTVIDLAPSIGDDLLGRILDEGAIKRLWTAEQVLGHLDQMGSRGRPGAARLRRQLLLRLEEGNPDSPLEQRVIRVLRPHVPAFKIHYADTFDGERIEMDLAWLDLKIDGEVDGMDVRSRSRTKFKRERLRQNVLAKYGWRILHFTSDMDDKELVAQIAALLPADWRP